MATPVQLTNEWLGEFVAMLARETKIGVAKMIAEAVAPRDAKITALEKQLEERPTGPGVRWAGIYADSKRYHEGELVTLRGALWLCLAGADAGQRPGSSAAWRLIVKSERAA